MLILEMFLQVLELPGDICNIVEVHYKPPGHVSAGMTCHLMVRLTPKVLVSSSDSPRDSEYSSMPSVA